MAVAVRGYWEVSLEYEGMSGVVCQVVDRWGGRRGEVAGRVDNPQIVFMPSSDCRRIVRCAVETTCAVPRRSPY